MILGVVLAGGQSSRFGSYKALAPWRGKKPLSLYAVDNIAGQADAVVIAGREEGPALCIPDWPEPGMGPLGGIAAGLRHAEANGFDSIMTCGVDSPDVSQIELSKLYPPPCYLADQPVIGHWPLSAVRVVETILRSDSKHSMREFAEAIGARGVKSDE